MPNSKRARLLIVDDDAAQLRALTDTLALQGYDTVGYASGAEAIDALRTQARFDLLLADLIMPVMGGIDLLEAALQIDRDLVAVIMTGEGTIATAVGAMKSGALDYILKPFNLSVILPVISRALAVRDLRMEVASLERSVQQRTAELEAANKELEAFAFSVSHDLRSPLTVIIGSLDTLTHDYAASLPEKGRESLARTLAGALRMSQIIDDLLRLSRVGREPLTKSKIDVGSLVREVLTELRAAQKGPDISVKIGDLPEATGDAALLRQVFVNLLSNALKFTRGKPSPLVEVGFCRTGDDGTYFVRDNGAGFDPRSAQDLFAAFRRLHGAEQFEGNGVGLSIVHRVVTRHGGRVWAEAQVDKGATFYFSLPLAEGPRIDRRVLPHTRDQAAM